MIIDVVSDGLTLVCAVALVGALLWGFLSAVVALGNLLMRTARGNDG